MFTYENKELDFRGTSQDEKPTNVPINTKFHELDTNDVYYYTGEAWLKVGGKKMIDNTVLQNRCSNYMDCDGSCFIDDTPCDCAGNIEKCKGR